MSMSCVPIEVVGYAQVRIGFPRRLLRSMVWLLTRRLSVCGEEGRRPQVGQAHLCFRESAKTFILLLIDDQSVGVKISPGFGKTCFEMEERIVRASDTSTQVEHLV